MKIIKCVFLAAWTLFCLVGIINNFNHYGIVNWIVIILLTFTPYIIMYFTQKRAPKKHPFVFNNRKNIKIAKYIFLVTWTLISIFSVRFFDNFTHYKVNDWIGVILLILTPYIIMYFIQKRKARNPNEHDNTNSDVETRNEQNEIANTAVPSKSNANDTIDNLDSLLCSMIKITTKPTKTTYPEEVLASMRTAYSPVQAQSDIRILNDCVDLLQNTENLETFFSRFELAMRKAYTLDQAKAAGISISTSITPKYILSLKKERADYVLQCAYTNELKKIATLKTSTGKMNRIDKFINSISGYQTTFEFSDTYENIINDLNLLKKKL